MMRYNEEMLYNGSQALFEDSQFQAAFNWNIKEELYRLLTKIMETYDFEAGSIYLENGTTPGTFEMVTSKGFSQQYCKDVNKIFMGMGFSGTAAELRQVRVSEDAENDIRFIRKKYKKNIKSFITVPLLSGEKVLGIIDLGSEKKRNFSLQEIEALALMGNLLGLYLHNSYQLWKIKKREHEAKQLYSLGKEIIGFEEINTICMVTLEECRVLMKADGAFVILEKDILHDKRVLSTGLALDSFTPEIITYLSNEFNQGGDHIIVRKKSGKNILSPLFKKNNIVRLYCIKLTVSDRTFGILGVTRSNPQFTYFDVSLFKRISWHLSLAISRYIFLQQSKSIAILEEQNRISRELHDSLAQQLLAMLHHIQYIHRLCKNERDEHLLPHIQSLMSIIEMTYTDVREAIFGLRITKMNGETSFEDALKKCIARFQNETDIEIVTNINLKIQLPFFAKIQLLRIIQEALTNIRKHSKATKAQIDILSMDNCLKIFICDNGIGFDVNVDNRGYGLSVMKERAEDIGAVINITSEKKKGTNITLILDNEKLGGINFEGPNNDCR